MPQILVTTTGTRILQREISFKIKRGKLASKTKSSIISKVNKKKNKKPLKDYHLLASLILNQSNITHMSDELSLGGPLAKIFWLSSSPRPS